MDDRMVSRLRPLILLFLCLVGCLPASHTAPLNRNTAPVAPTESIMPTGPSPTATFTPSPEAIDWPVKDAEDLKKAFRDAQVVLINIEGFLLCPPFYDNQGKIDPEVCTSLQFEVGEKGRQRLIEAIEEGGTRAMQIPEELRPMNPLAGPEWPYFRLFVVLDEFRLTFLWYTNRSFNVAQAFFPAKNIWHPDPRVYVELRWVEFVQEKPVLYESVKEMVPPFRLPPEHLGHLLQYERVVVEYDDKKCEYSGFYPSFVRFIFCLLKNSLPVREERPSSKPRAVFTFWVHGKAYPVEMWEDGRFSYNGKMYRYLPSLGGMLEEFLLWLSFVECKQPGE